MTGRSLMSRNSIVPRRDDFFFPLEQTFNKFFEEFFSNDRLDGVKGVGGYPKMNAYVAEGELVMHLGVPGMTTENLKVELKPDNILSVSGKMSDEYGTPQSATTGWRHELRQSAFERQFQLPEYVEGDPSASLKDGILTLKWKVKEDKKPTNVSKQIQISSG